MKQENGCKRCEYLEREYSLMRAGLIREQGFNAEKRDAINRLQSELAALRQPPRCPGCGTEDIVVARNDEYGWVVCCMLCDENITGETLDVALNAWRRPVEKGTK